MNRFLPRGQVTGIGSLPHRDAEAAVRFVATYSPTIPFWPQLPQRTAHDTMITQMIAPVRDLFVSHGPARLTIAPGKSAEVIERLQSCEAALEPESAAGFFAFEDAARAGEFPQAEALKGHLTGPVTLAQCLFDDGTPLIASPALYKALVDYVCRLGKWQVERLRQWHEHVLIFIDEPALDVSSGDAVILAGVQRLIVTLRAAGALVGIHSCATLLPDTVIALEPDIVSFDAHIGLEHFVASAAADAYLQNGGWVAFGLVPTWDTPATFEPTLAFMRWLTTMEKRYAIPQLAARTLITATCGLGLLSEVAAADSFAACHEVSHLVQRTMEVAPTPLRG